MIWDFTGVDTLAPSHIPNTSTVAGKAAEQAETKKHATYQDLKSTYHFVPIALETLGTWGKEGLKFLKELGARIAEETGEKRAKTFLFQSLSIANQRGNAINISGTVSNAKQLDEIYYL